MAIRWFGGLVLLVLLWGVTDSATGGDWLVFRGDPSQKGIADCKLGGKLKVRWKVEGMESIEGTAAVREKRMIIGGMDGSLRCMEVDSGKECWKLKTGMIKAPACWDGDFVFVGDVDGKFIAVDVKSGTQKWSYEAKGEISGGATVAGDRILFGCQDETIRCLDKAGKFVWEFKTEGPYYGSMAVAGGKTFAAGCDSTLHVINVENGKEESKVDLGGQTGATVAVDGEQLFIGTMNREFLRVDWKKGEIPWRFMAENRPQEFYSSAAIARELVVVGSRDNRIHAFDRKTGKQAWSVLTKGKVDGSPVITLDAVVHVGCLDGKLYSLDLATGKELGVVELDDGISASPAIVDGKLIIGTQKGTLYCLEGE